MELTSKTKKKIELIIELFLLVSCIILIIFANYYWIIGAIIGIILLIYSILIKREEMDKMPHIQFKISLDNFYLDKKIITYSPILIKNIGKDDANGVKARIEWGKKKSRFINYWWKKIQNLNYYFNIKSVILELIKNKILLLKLKFEEKPKKEMIKTKTSLLPGEEMAIELNSILDKLPEGKKFVCKIICSDENGLNNHCTKAIIELRKKINFRKFRIDFDKDSFEYGKRPFFGVDYLFEKDEPYQDEPYQNEEIIEG